MAKPLLELSSNLSWNLLTRRQLVAAPGSEPNTYIPIPRQNFLCESNLMLIAFKNPRARVNWWLGAWVSVNLLISPDTYTDFASVAEIQRQSCPLKKFTLMHWKAYDPKPYAILVEIPWWHEEIQFEAYWYDGSESDTYEQLLLDINQKLDEF